MGNTIKNVKKHMMYSEVNIKCNKCINRLDTVFTESTPYLIVHPNGLFNFANIDNSNIIIIKNKKKFLYHKKTINGSNGIKFIVRSFVDDNYKQNNIVLRFLSNKHIKITENEKKYLSSGSILLIKSIGDAFIDFNIDDIHWILCS